MVEEVGDKVNEEAKEEEGNGNQPGDEVLEHGDDKAQEEKDNADSNDTTTIIENNLNDLDERSKSPVSEEEEEPQEGASKATVIINTRENFVNANITSINEIDFLQDPIEHQTYGRQIARWLARHYPIYYGIAPNPDKPSLDKAWAFFEHVTLQRYIVDEHDAALAAARSSTTAHDNSKRERLKRAFHQGDRRLSIAEPGEQEFQTKLYPPLSTPLSQLGDFGLGFGIYFATIRDFALLFLLGGLLSIPNMVYFASDYSAGQEGLAFTLQGSAICTDREWVPCPTCSQKEFEEVNDGSYNIDRFVTDWTVAPNEENRGFYLNVTQYLHWEDPDNLERTPERVVRLDQLKGTHFLPAYGIVLHETNGYILNGVNVTEKLGTTPLWCSYKGPSDCYLDLYPFLEGKDDEAADKDELLAQADTPQEGDTDFFLVGFAWKNKCDGATLEQGFINYGALLLMILGTVIIWIRVKRVEVKFDEDEQTAQDYSIVIYNPPSDAFDPDEWKQFFEKALSGAVSDPTVRVCTVNVDNDIIIGHLVKRREALRNLQLALPQGTSLDRATLERHARKAEAEKSMCGVLNSSKIPTLFQSLQTIDGTIKTFFETAKRAPTTRVYITFETEAAQRQVLSQTAASALAVHNNTITAVPQTYLFRGKHVLDVDEPDEPTAIRWEELNETQFTILFRLGITNSTTVAFVVAAYYIISELYKENYPWAATYATAIFSGAFGAVANILMNMEVHQSETSRQKWLYNKVAFFNVLVTTVFLSLITPFQATLDQAENKLPGLLPTVNKLFWSQLSTAPVLQLLDIGGFLKRHILAPRAKTQEEANMCMRGSPVHLAQRYANLMKFLFLTLWYCSIYPGVFFLGFLALLITYFVDRFSLMRSWARSPQVGADVADFPRQFSLAIVVMSVVSAYFWSGFKYDNLCLDERTPLPQYYFGDYNISVEAETATTADLLGDFDVLGSVSFYSAGGVRAQFSIDENAEVYRFCNQDLRSLEKQSFPALPEFQPSGDEWMTPEQEKVVSAHGWSSLIILCITVVLIIGVIMVRIHRKVSGTNIPRGEDQNIPFSDVRAIDSYIPNVSSPLIPYPLLLCNIQDIDTQLFNWKDDANPHSHYDVTNDVAEILGTSSYAEVFAKVKHWPVIASKTRQGQRDNSALSQDSAEELIEEIIQV